MGDVTSGRSLRPSAQRGARAHAAGRPVLGLLHVVGSFAEWEQSGSHMGLLDWNARVYVHNGTCGETVKCAAVSLLPRDVQLCRSSSGDAICAMPSGLPRAVTTGRQPLN